MVVVAMAVAEVEVTDVDVVVRDEDPVCNTLAIKPTNNLHGALRLKQILQFWRR